MDELKKLKIITNQREFTKACVWLFSWEERWKAHYGGKAWERIARTLLGHGTTSNVLFVDRCWGMQHNVAIWLDKVQIPRSRQKELAKTVNEVDKEVGLTAPERDFIPTHLIWKNYLPAILDANAEGNHRFVWLWAKEFDPQLEKYKRILEEKK